MANQPINLNKARKARARAQRKREADRNAVVHGLPKSERQKLERENALWRNRVEGARRADAAPPGLDTGADAATPDAAVETDGQKPGADPDA